mgnify:FL=1
MQVGDLVRVLHHDSAGDIQPYNGRTGLLIEVVPQHPNSIYYNVLLSGETNALKFRGYLLEVISASR